MSSRISQIHDTPEGEATPSASEVIMTLMKTTQHLRRVFNARLSSQGESTKLSGTRIRLLLAIEEAGQLRMGDLAADLGITARSVTTLVDALEKMELLARLPDPTDRRATLLELTDTARTHFEQVRSLQTELSEELLAPLDLQQRQQLFVLLNLLNKGMQVDVSDDEE